tara:strand:- start:5190 stop:5618 length:429 start_codon:yes stop_codon:yes gene_type:complete
MIYVSGIPSSKISEVWIICKDYIEMGNNKSHEEMTIDDIYEKLLKSEMQLWLIFDEDSNIKSVLTTEIVIYPRKKTCRIVTLGGKGLDDWCEQLLDVIEKWAIENDCVAMETACRKGFIKKIKKYGYDHAYTILGKDLTTLH